jgi:hypothetical protein
LFVQTLVQNIIKLILPCVLHKEVNLKHAWAGAERTRHVGSVYVIGKDVARDEGEKQSGEGLTSQRHRRV